MNADEVLRRALRIVKPSGRDAKRLHSIVEKALKIAKMESSKIDGIVDVTLEGSAAKNTWIKGREEADIFIHFDPNISREELKEKIIRLGVEVIQKLGGEPRLMYADHPYVEGSLNGVTVDVVACYRTEPLKWISATDRTPYHTRYVIENLKPGQEDEVRLLKGFMVGCGVYGAEIKVKGFSGYLTELLVINYGSFLNVLREAAEWRSPIVLDPGKHYESRDEVLELFKGNPIIVVDPVDKGRNAAAAVSETRLCEFILAAKLFLEKPSLRFFSRKEKKVRISDVKRLAKDRHFLYVYFKLKEERPPDVIWGELKRSEEGASKALERLGFTVYRSGSWTDEQAVCLLVFELNQVNLSRYMIHRGPPVHIENAENFVSRWLKKGIGPWVEGNRLYVLRKRDEVNAAKLLKSEIAQGRIAISKGIINEVKAGKIGDNLDYLIRIGKKRRDLLKFLASFLQAKPPFLENE